MLHSVKSMHDSVHVVRHGFFFASLHDSDMAE
jgi:hypothetical protein